MSLLPCVGCCVVTYALSDRILLIHIAMLCVVDHNGPHLLNARHFSAAEDRYGVGTNPVSEMQGLIHGGSNVAPLDTKLPDVTRILNVSWDIVVWPACSRYCHSEPIHHACRDIRCLSAAYGAS